jgi:hypothetical protein
LVDITPSTFVADVSVMHAVNGEGLEELYCTYASLFLHEFDGLSQG